MSKKLLLSTADRGSHEKFFRQRFLSGSGKQTLHAAAVLFVWQKQLEKLAAYARMRSAQYQELLARQLAELPATCGNLPLKSDYIQRYNQVLAGHRAASAQTIINNLRLMLKEVVRQDHACDFTMIAMVFNYIYFQNQREFHDRDSLSAVSCKLQYLIESLQQHLREIHNPTCPAELLKVNLCGILEEIIPRTLLIDADDSPLAQFINDEPDPAVRHRAISALSVIACRIKARISTEEDQIILQRAYRSEQSIRKILEAALQLGPSRFRRQGNLKVMQ